MNNNHQQISSNVNNLGLNINYHARISAKRCLITNFNDFITKLHEDYWLIENIQKPLNAPSAYTLNELQSIANKLQITTHSQVNEKSKAKTKTALYEEILQTI